MEINEQYLHVQSAILGCICRTKIQSTDLQATGNGVELQLPTKAPIPQRQLDKSPTVSFARKTSCSQILLQVKQTEQHPLVMFFYLAMEHYPFIDDLPIKHGDFP